MILQFLYCQIHSWELIFVRILKIFGGYAPKYWPIPCFSVRFVPRGQTCQRISKIFMGFTPKHSILPLLLNSLPILKRFHLLRVRLVREVNIESKFCLIPHLNSQIRWWIYEKASRANQRGVGATVARQKWVCRHENLSTHGWVCGTQKKKP